MATLKSPAFWRSRRQEPGDGRPSRPDPWEPGAETPPATRQAIALRGMLEAWNAWLEQHVMEIDLQLSEALEANAKTWCL